MLHCLYFTRSDTEVYSKGEGVGWFSNESLGPKLTNGVIFERSTVNWILAVMPGRGRCCRTVR